MRESAAADLSDTVQRSMIDDEVSCDRQVGTCRDSPSDLCLRQASAGAELSKALRRDCEASPLKQGDGLPHAIRNRG
jgi:hypothetical protein